MTKIEITQPKCINGESLQNWLQELLKDDLKEVTIYLLPNIPLDCTSESKSFTTIDIDSTIDKNTLLSKIAECSNERNAYFYIQDVVETACGLGFLNDTYYHFFHENAH
jgi:hypothetical protein